jgi:hypothetical protein
MADEYPPRPVARPGIEERGPLERYYVWRSQDSYDRNEAPFPIDLRDMRALAFAQAQAENRGVNPPEVANLALPTALVEGRPSADDRGRGYAQPAYGANSIEIPQFHMKKYGNPVYDATWKFPAEVRPGVFYGPDPNISPAGMMGLGITPKLDIEGGKNLRGEIMPLRAGDTTVVDKHGNKFLDNYRPSVPVNEYYDKTYPYNAPHRAEVATPYDAALHQAQLLQAHLAAANSRAGNRPIAAAWNGRGVTRDRTGRVIADSANHGDKVEEMQRMLQHPANSGTLNAYRYMLNNFRKTLQE